jgi:hypothetical protein
MLSSGPDVFSELAAEDKVFSPERDQGKADYLRRRLFTEQVDYLDDPSRRKTLLCPRRSGKTFVAAVDLVDTCLRRTTANCVFITLTKGSARALMWEQLKLIDKELDLGCHFHNTFLTCTFPGDTIRRITLTGAETRGEIEKLRGQFFDKVIIDECKSFPSHILNELVRDVIGPALNDTMGTITLMGTPGNVLAGVFYESTRDYSPIMRLYRDRDRQKGKLWSGHKWGVADNVAMPHLWPACLADKESYGWSDENPIWQREYLGRWVADDDAFVYRFNPAINTWARDPDSENKWGLPSGHEWKYILGCDLGYDDPFSIVVAAFSPTCNTFYQVYDYKEAGCNVSDIARIIKRVREEFGEFEIMVGDRGGLGKMVLAELAERHDLFIEAAEKTEKRDYIELLNSDMSEGNVKILEDSGLVEEMSVLVWKDGSREKEDPACSNHICDAFLYIWRYSYHNFARPLEKPPVPGSIEFWEKKLQEEKQAIYARKRKSRELDGFQRLTEEILDDGAFTNMENLWDLL